MTHTPGPWILDSYPKYLNLYWVWNSDKSQIIGDFIKSKPNALENAILISAAPSLLSALQNLAADMEENLKELGGCDHSVGICFCSWRAHLDTAVDAIKAATLPGVVEPEGEIGKAALQDDAHRKAGR